VNKILHVALREFLATVLTKGFLFGLLIVPLLIGAMVLLLPRLAAQEALGIEGEIAILDRSGLVLESARAQLAPAAFAERRQAMRERLDAAIPGAVRRTRSESEIRDGLEQVLGEVPQLQVIALDADADIEAEKDRLHSDGERAGRRLAVLVVHADAVRAGGGDAVPAEGLGSYDLYVPPKLDDRLVDELRDAMRRALVEARLSARGIDAAQVQALTRVPFVRASVVEADGASDRNEIAGQLLPMAFMVLMLLAVMTAGQQLMTSTIEEKSSRVVELLLAAVSPTQLMAGKVLGQLGVATLMLGLYGGLGLLALASFALMGLVAPGLLLQFFLFFLIAFVTLACLMAAIGAAVNELREAQSLLTPVMLVVMLPMMLWLPISRDPNSLFATVLSLAPPVSPFVMVLRLSSNTPPPDWQVWLSLLIGVAGVWASIWFAGKVFRVGLLMFGKPPNLLTLWRWVRMS
jgi:ABC-type Na+ efflux pump permease subunit